MTHTLFYNIYLYYIYIYTVVGGHRVQKNPKIWKFVPYDPVPYDPVPYNPVPYDQGALFGLLPKGQIERIKLISRNLLMSYKPPYP